MTKPPGRGVYIDFASMTGTDVDDDLLKQCAALFSNNYGVWGVDGAMPGLHVKMSAKKLRKQCLDIPEKSVLVTCMSNGVLCGHAFATVWEWDAGVVGWITQLVVDRSYRKSYIATFLLQCLKKHELFQQVTAVGLVSSHPAACTALAKYARLSLADINLDFIRSHAENVLRASPVSYLSSAQLRGSLFESNSTLGAVSSAYTSFFVDHEEPLETLAAFRSSKKGWPLGELLDGHEYLILVPVSPITTSTERAQI